MEKRFRLMPTRLSVGDRAFYILAFLVIVFVVVITFYPLYFVVIASISSPSMVAMGQVILWPAKLQVTAFTRIYANRMIWISYGNSIVYTFVGTAINLIMTMIAGFVMSRKELLGSRYLFLVFIFTMYFSGGLVPTYLVVRQLGLLDSIWALVLPGAIATYNLILARTFIGATIPDEMEDASRIDGCSHIQFFLRIVLPLSGPIVGVLTLYYAVGHWNSFMSALLYMRERPKYPLQLILREILVQNQLSAADLEMTEDISQMMSKYELSQSIKFAVIVVSILPMMILYPFMQRFFVKGVMIGAIKG